MRFSQICPKCTSRTFAVTREFRQGSYHSGEEHWTVPVHAVAVPTGDSSAAENSQTGAVKRGHFESWICLKCGYTEFYAYGLDQVREIARQWPDRVRIVDAEAPAQGPYR